MNCDSCGADIADGAKYCPICGKGRNSFRIECPYCANSMESGSAKIHGTFGGFLIFGFSYEHLFFKKKDGSEKRILKSRSEKEAYFCDNCESIFIPSY